MHRDQAYGGLILTVAVVLILVFNLWIWDLWFFYGLSPWIIKITIWLLVMLVLGIAAWIGYTMAATPPPRPIEDLAPPPISTEPEKPSAPTTSPETKERKEPSKATETKRK